jgi:hypothetical protein
MITIFQGTFMNIKILLFATLAIIPSIYGFKV